MMTPGIREKLCARMRVAVTRACVSFPRVDPNPIAVALWQTYNATALVMGSTYPMNFPQVEAEIQNFTDMAVEWLLNKKELKTATVGMSQRDQREYSQVGFGLDQATAMNLFRYKQQYRTDFLGVSTQRLTALRSRRNHIANQMVDLAVQQAYITMSQMERGEGISQTSPPRMST